MPDHFYVYPAYLTRGISRADGRRVPASVAVPEATVEAIAEAAKRLGYAVEVEAAKSYPRLPHRLAGRVKVTKRPGVSKAGSLRRIGEAMNQLPAAPGAKA